MLLLARLCYFAIFVFCLYFINYFVRVCLMGDYMISSVADAYSCISFVVFGCVWFAENVLQKKSIFKKIRYFIIFEKVFKSLSKECFLVLAADGVCRKFVKKMICRKMFSGNVGRNFFS